MSRALPPVYSPLSLRALVRGLRASLRPAAAAAAEQVVRAALREGGLTGKILFTDSGTSALALAIQLASRGDPVAIPAYGCYDIATAVDAAGVDFLQYDVDPSSLAPSPDSLKAAVMAGARTVVVVHHHGSPVDIPSLRALLPAGTRIVDDAAQGVGGSVRGTALGALGDFGVLSFGRGKGLTGGSGGALVLSRGIEVGRLPLPAAAGSVLGALVTTKAQWLLARPGLYALPRALPFLGLGETHYGQPRPPTRISPFALGVISDGVGRVEHELAARRRTVLRYREALAGVSCVSLPADVAGAGWLRFPVLVGAGSTALARAAESSRLGIMPGYPFALSDLPGFGTRRRNVNTDFPGARVLASHLFTLPTHGALASADVEAVIARVRSWS